MGVAHYLPQSPLSKMSGRGKGGIAPLLPAPKRRGRKPTDPQAILNAMFYMIRCGCPWRCLPKDFPSFTTVQNRFYALRDSGLWTQIVSVFVTDAREAEGREAAPTGIVVDSQSVKTTEAGGARGFDAGKKVKGRKRHLAVDTLGLPVECQITAASLQDRDALAPLLKAVRLKSPWMKMSFVDGGYQGGEAQRAAFEASRIAITGVKRTGKEVKGFVVLPKCWVVERTLGWINRARRLSKDFEDNGIGARMDASPSSSCGDWRERKSPQLEFRVRLSSRSDSRPRTSAHKPG
jgi:transposase